MRRRLTLLALLGAGSVAMLLGTFSDAWLEELAGADFAVVGLREMRVCLGDHCSAAALRDLRIEADAFVNAAFVTFHAALVAATLAVLSGALTARGRTRRRARVPRRLGIVAFAATVAAGVTFLLTRHRAFADFELGVGPWLALGGAVASGLALVLLELDERPPAQEQLRIDVFS